MAWVGATMKNVIIMYLSVVLDIVFGDSCQNYFKILTFY